jgi:hypothetical protein
MELRRDMPSPRSCGGCSIVRRFAEAGIGKCIRKPASARFLAHGRAVAGGVSSTAESAANPRDDGSDGSVQRPNRCAGSLFALSADGLRGCQLV